MSWLFSQALVVEYLGDICLDGEQSVPLNGKNTQQAYCSQDKMTEFSRLSRFGMMFKPLMETRGEELLMLYLADFHAKTLVLPEKGLELKENGQECGKKWQELLAKLDPSTFLWKTPQCLFVEDLAQSLQTWPRWGSMRNGECYQQPMLEQTIKGTEFGLSQKVNWPTPTCQDANKATKKYRENHQNNLTAMVFNPHKMFPTPTSRDYKGGYKTESLIRKDGKSRALDALPNAVLDGKGVETVTGHLNPTWVEWLMGWPLEWTDLKPLEMDKCLYVHQPLLDC
jgi:hypothetical protein